MIERPSFTLNRSAVILLIVVLVLVGGGWALGYAMGTDHGKLVAAQNPPRQQTVNGTVKSADAKGMTVQTPNGDWKLVYSDTTEFRSGVNEINKADFKKGDAVRAVGTAGGEQKSRTLNARTVVKTPARASAAPKAGDAKSGAATTTKEDATKSETTKQAPTIDAPDKEAVKQP